MRRLRAALLLAAAAAFTGCVAAHPPATDPAALAKCLPPDLTLSTVIDANPEGKGLTVADKLAEMGAHVGADGKLRDRRGKEVTFYKRLSLWWGARPPNYDEVVRKEEDELRELRRRSTVIVVGPGFQPP
jgi:hypothetical protein